MKQHIVPLKRSKRDVFYINLQMEHEYVAFVHKSIISLNILFE